MILVCPTAFKGTLSATAVAEALTEGARDAGLTAIETLPLSDGGNGLLDAVQSALGGRRLEVQVSGPLGDPVRAAWLDTGALRVIETAEASGLHHVPHDRRDPMRTSTFGVGQLLRAADAAPGPARLVVGLGGSATVDAGAGMARALGWRLLDARGEPIVAGGVGLETLAAIEPPDQPPVRPPLVLADVTNPLLGPTGAAAVYAPQKGASPREVERLARGLERWARVVERDLGRDVAMLEAGGAAGGLGAAFAALLDAPPVRGAPWVLDAAGFDARLARTDVVVTAEGAWDAQSSMGKIVGEVVERARTNGVPVLLIAGSIAGDLPPGVVGLPGGVPVLDEAGVARLARDGLRALLRHGGDP